jgi:hypothetical protein
MVRVAQLVAGSPSFLLLGKVVGVARLFAGSPSLEKTARNLPPLGKVVRVARLVAGSPSFLF